MKMIQRFSTISGNWENQLKEPIEEKLARRWIAKQYARFKKMGQPKYYIYRIRKA